LDWESWSTREIGSLLAQDGQLQGHSLARIGAGIRNALPTCSQTEVTRLLGVSDNRFALLRSRNKTLSLEFLCRTSFLLGISVIKLLTEKPDQWKVGKIRRGPWERSSRTLVETSRQTIAEQLERLLVEGCPSLREASRRLGRSRMTLIRHFPEQSAKILSRSSKRYAWRAPYRTRAQKDSGFSFTEFSASKNGPFADRHAAKASARR